MEKMVKACPYCGNIVDGQNNKQRQLNKCGVCDSDLVDIDMPIGTYYQLWDTWHLINNYPDIIYQYKMEKYILPMGKYKNGDTRWLSSSPIVVVHDFDFSVFELPLEEQQAIADELYKKQLHSENLERIRNPPKPPEPPQVKCPRCGSTQVTMHKRGWKLVTGFLGSSSMVNTCMNCGQNWYPSQIK